MTVRRRSASWVLLLAGICLACPTSRGYVSFSGPVTGLTGKGLVLSLNGTETLSLDPGATNFSFATAVEAGSIYNITILHQPTTAGETCTVVSGTGVVGSVEPAGLGVICGTTTYSVSVTISGLPDLATATVQLNDQVLSKLDGSYTFQFGIPSGAAYSVSVFAAPTGYTCHVANGSGTISADVTGVEVTCSTTAFSVGGSVSGTAGAGIGLSLQYPWFGEQITQSLSQSGDGSFTFPDQVPTSAVYTVSVTSPPAGDFCFLSNGGGTMASSNVTDVAVNCVPQVPSPVGVTVELLEGSGLVLTMNYEENGQALSQVLAVSASGTFSFPVEPKVGDTYVVTVTTQPTAPSQTCVVNGGSGQVVANGQSLTVVCSSWKSVTSPSNGFLTGLFETSDGSAFAVGVGGVILSESAGTWTAVVPSPTTANLTGLWASGPTDVWAVGSSGTILHYDGKSWTALAGVTNQSLNAVFGTSATNVFAVGAHGTILAYDGSSWTSEASHSTDNLLGVWGSGPADVYAVTDSGAILHYDGTAWSVSTYGSTLLAGIWGTGPGNVWAVGYQGTIERWNGTSWSSSSSGTTENLRGIWGSGPADVWAVGYSGTILHFDGAVWSPVASGTTAPLSAVYGASSSNVYAVGQLGTILAWAP